MTGPVTREEYESLCARVARLETQAEGEVRQTAPPPDRAFLYAKVAAAFSDPFRASRVIRAAKADPVLRRALVAADVSNAKTLGRLLAAATDVFEKVGTDKRRRGTTWRARARVCGFVEPKPASSTLVEK